jgi:hypothetical protein
MSLARFWVLSIVSCEATRVPSLASFTYPRRRVRVSEKRLVASGLRLVRSSSRSENADAAASANAFDSWISNWLVTLPSSVPWP